MMSLVVNSSVLSMLVKKPATITHRIKKKPSYQSTNAWLFTRQRQRQPSLHLCVPRFGAYGPDTAGHICCGRSSTRSSSHWKITIYVVMIPSSVATIGPSKLRERTCEGSESRVRSHHLSSVHIWSLSDRPERVYRTGNSRTALGRDGWRTLIEGYGLGWKMQGQWHQSSPRRFALSSLVRNACDPASPVPYINVYCLPCHQQKLHDARLG